MGAVITLLMFPFLVVIAYLADKGWMNKLFCYNPDKPENKQQQIELGSSQPGESEGMLENTDFFKGGRVDQNALVGYIKAIKKNTKSRIWYRNMTGGRKIQPTMKMTDKLKEVYDAIN